eukprot:1190897-Prorocentrum_minimum.AAC.1
MRKASYIEIAASGSYGGVTKCLNVANVDQKEPGSRVSRAARAKYVFHTCVEAKGSKHLTNTQCVTIMTGPIMHNIAKTQHMHAKAGRVHGEIINK